MSFLVGNFHEMSLRGIVLNSKVCLTIRVSPVQDHVMKRNFKVWSSQQAFCNLIGQRGPIVQLIINEMINESEEGQCPAFP